MGESGKNQALPMQDQDMTLSDALGEGFGLNPVIRKLEFMYYALTQMIDKLNFII